MRRSVAMSDLLYERLNETAKRKGVSTGTIIRIACGEYLEREKTIKTMSENKTEEILNRKHRED